MTGSNYSHVMLYVDFNSIIHANGEGVHAYNTQRILFDDKKQCVVFRLKETIDEKSLNNIIKYMRVLIGRPYSTFEAMLTKIYKGKWKSKRLFCSRLVAQAFSNENINLVDNDNYCTPENIRQSKHLKKVIAPLRKLTEIEKTIILTKKDKPFEQAKITNHLFSEIVKFTSNKELYDFDTLINFLKDNNKFDKDLSNIIKDSGYLTMWIEELKDNAALYNIDLYNACISNDQMIFFSKSTLDGLKRYHENHQKYLVLFSKYKLSVFYNLLTLYAILYRIESLRLEVLQKIECQKGPNNEIFHFLEFLIKLFFVRYSLLDILKEKRFEISYYKLISDNIKFLISNYINMKSNEFNLEKDFLKVVTYLTKLDNIFTSIINTEIIQKRDSTIFYKNLETETNELVKIIDTINFTNIFSA